MKLKIIKVLFCCLFSVVFSGCKFALRDASAQIGEITAEPVSN